MCLLAFGWRASPGLRLALVGNRDEFHARPTAPLHAWPDADGHPRPADAPVLAGRDLQAGGTWCGVGPGGRVAALTNFRDGTAPPAGAPSRGRLVADFLAAQVTALDYAAQVHREAKGLAGFSLLVADDAAAVVVSNRAAAPVALGPGVYGLSNHLLDTPWPKVVRSRERLAALLATGAPTPAAMVALLMDRTTAEDLADTTPDPGRAALLARYGADFARRLSAPFVLDERYGTRATTAILVRDAGDGEVLEVQHAADGSECGRQHLAWPQPAGAAA